MFVDHRLLTCNLGPFETRTASISTPRALFQSVPAREGSIFRYVIFNYFVRYPSSVAIPDRFSDSPIAFCL